MSNEISQYLFPESDIPVARSRRPLATPNRHLVNSSPLHTSRTPTSAQREAITNIEGPLLVIAGPGSGKTFTLVERVVHLVREKELAPENLLVVTFTNKAARELISRISTQLANAEIAFRLDDMYIGTFHSICLSILRKYIHRTEFAKQVVQLDDFDQQYFIYERLDQYQKIAHTKHIWAKTDSRIDSQSRSSHPLPPEARRWNYAADIKYWMNRINEEMIDLNSLKNASKQELHGLADCYQLYRQHLVESKVVDFSSVQAETLRLFRLHPTVLEELQSQVQYIMVDEYQDTSIIQERLLFDIAGKNQNICVVGDDDQSLYRFRSARVENILDFSNHFEPGVCKKIRLETNFRSHPSIIEFYNEWMKKGAWNENGQTFRHEKEIVPSSEHDFDRKQPSVFQVPNSQLNIPHFLKQLKSKGYISDWNQVVFLSRSVRDPEVQRLQKALETEGIGVYSPRARMFFQRREIQLIIGGLIYLFADFDQLRRWNQTAKLAIWEYYDHQCRPLFQKELDKTENHDLAQWCKKRADFFQNLEKDTDQTLVKSFYGLLQFNLFAQYIKKTDTELERRSAHNLAKMSEILESFQRHHRVVSFNRENLATQVQNFFNKFMTFLYNDVSEYEDELVVCPSGCVTFMTIHQAKGLEFPVVVLTSLDTLGHSAKISRLESFIKQISNSGKEPEWKVSDFDAWRLFYTAFSRAQDMLVMTWEKKPHLKLEKLLSQVPNGIKQTLSAPKRRLKPVKKSDVIQPYTFSEHFNLFSSCPRQYHFFQELNFVRYEKEPWLFGTLVHHTIQDIHQKVLEQQKNSQIPAIDEGWLRGRLEYNYTVLQYQKGLDLQEQILDQAWQDVSRYVEKEKESWSLIEWSELNVSRSEGNYILNGKVDLVKRYKNGLEIIDFRTGRQEELELDTDKLEQYRHQLDIYAYLVENQDHKKRPVLRVSLYLTSRDKHPVLTLQRRDKDLNMEPFNQMVKKIEARDFDMAKRPEKICQTCEMTSYCDAQSSCS